MQSRLDAKEETDDEHRRQQNVPARKKAAERRAAVHATTNKGFEESPLPHVILSALKRVLDRIT